jgi:hypothetical protein
MNTETKVNNPLRGWYHNLPAKDLKKGRLEVQKACGVNAATFYRWISGKTPVPYAAQVIINQIAGKIYDVEQPVPIS